MLSSKKLRPCFLEFAVDEVVLKLEVYLALAKREKN